MERPDRSLNCGTPSEIRETKARLIKSIISVVLGAVVVTTIPAVARAENGCGVPNAHWLIDIHVNGTGQAPQIVVPINARLNLEVSEEVGITIIARDRRTGENIFGTPPHGAEAYYLTPWDVRARRAGRVLSTNEIGNIIPLDTGWYGGELIADARELYSNREDPEDTTQYEVFSKGVLHICWKQHGH